jgi:hypothetical protein
MLFAVPGFIVAPQQPEMLGLGMTPGFRIS